jgi:hypothetical protein
MIVLPDGRVFLSVPPQEGVTFEEAQAAIRKLRQQLDLAGVPLAGDSPVETHIPSAEHEAIHQAERESHHA